LNFRKIDGAGDRGGKEVGTKLLRSRLAVDHRPIVCDGGLAVSGTMDGRVIEYVDHLHEHFEDPTVVRRGRYLAPMRPGYSITMREASRRAHRYPDGEVWMATSETRPLRPDL
jgi:hypothetical protein